MRLLRLAAVLATATLAAHASTIASASGGSGVFGSKFAGESFTITGAGSFDDVTFNFYSSTGTASPYAIGTGYLFSAAYKGTPAGLSQSNVNLLGAAHSANGLYSFDPTLTLTAGTQYFFYEDASIPLGTIYGFNSYTGGLAFYSYTSQDDFGGTLPLNFNVSGQAVTPEPSSIVLLGSGVLGVAGVLRKRFVTA